MVRKHIIFGGRVQGVGFRYTATYKAQELGLTGWVRNEYDGTVEMEVQGNALNISLLLSFLYQQRLIRIDRMDEQTIPVVKDEKRFRERW